MELRLHPDAQLQKLTIGREQAPLIVIDNFVFDAERLADAAAARHFMMGGRYFPGVRTKAPLLYRRFLIHELQQTLIEYFELKDGTLTFSMCHYSLVTTPPAKLGPLQRIPHIDSASGGGLATIHYLFRKELGGTAFYRHRSTGFEYVDESRSEEYYRTLQSEMNGADAPPPAYINGDTPLFERVSAEEGLFNRILIYKRNSLHSGSIDSRFVPDSNPRSGRLSINSFIDALPKQVGPSPG